MQQEETLEFFKKYASEWSIKAEDAGKTKVNVIKQRNDYVTMVANELDNVNSFLDIGCGTGDLVGTIAKKNIKSIGVDFSEEMIELANNKFSSLLKSYANFYCSSIFDFSMNNNHYDLISANGFIEYISMDQLDSLIDNVYNSLTPKGSFIVGSRNRLFNLASMNSFTLQEMKDNSLEHLLIEAVAWTNSKKISNMLTIDSAAYQGSDLKHADTGIDVYTRFQYTPLQLINLLRQRGFDVIEVYPINIHCMPPLFLNDNSEINATIANLLQSISRNKSYFIPRSSSFMLHAKKAT
jgi:2-polyprenyl-3-methyl-5-hydroxy-6-metoxy-1,4-benzoquinol methylase